MQKSSCGRVVNYANIISKKVNSASDGSRRNPRHGFFHRLGDNLCHRHFRSASNTCLTPAHRQQNLVRPAAPARQRHVRGHFAQHRVAQHHANRAKNQIRHPGAYHDGVFARRHLVCPRGASPPSPARSSPPQSAADSAALSSAPRPAAAPCRRPAHQE